MRREGARTGTAKLVAIDGRAVEARDASAPEWLPIELAQFFFFPNYVPPGPNFLAAVKSILSLYESQVGRLFRRGAKPRDPEISASGDNSEILTVGLGQMNLEIEAAAGDMRLIPIHNWAWEIFDEYGWVYGNPDDCISRLGQIKKSGLKAKYRGTFMFADSLLHFYWSTMKRHFGTAIADGHAQIWGRWNSPSAPLRRIDPGQWAYFEMRTEERDRTRLHYADGRLERVKDVIFQVCVEPIMRAVTPSERAESDCTSWLIADRMAYPDLPLYSRSKYEENAISKFPGLTKNGFERAWAEASKQIPAKGWGPGRRPKNKPPHQI